MGFDFQPMVDTAFATFGVAGEDYPAGGPAVSCTVVLKRPEVTGFLARSNFALSAEAQTVALTVDVRKSEVELAKRGDTLVIGEQPYTVREQPVLDAEKLVWTLAL